MSRTPTGSPAGRHSAPCCAYCPACSFFLASTLTTGSPAARYSSAAPLMYRNWASRSGCCFPSMVLALPCRLNPWACSSLSTVSAETGCPAAVSSSARFRVDLTVHRSGDIGSPRSSGSTRASSAGTSPGSVSARRLRPPPARRARPSGSAPDSSSATPSDTVASRTSAARATSLIPPWPSARASAPSSSRRCRSSRCGKSDPNFAASISRVTVTSPIPQQPARNQEATDYFLTNPSHLDVTSVWLLESASCGESAAAVAAVAVPADAAGPAGDQVAASADDARPQEGPGHRAGPAGPGDAHAARGQVTAGAPARKEKPRPCPQHRNQGHRITSATPPQHTSTHRNRPGAGRTAAADRRQRHDRVQARTLEKTRDSLNCATRFRGNVRRNAAVCQPGDSVQAGAPCPARPPA